ncbi:kelch-like protein 24 [Branchiostoma floridae]|uniref:Kelch-like protein 24 n=1 Tax=Branchiostoma floridae TaxID=7739 RepID=A0A9J7NBA1_BRAFL|nr:kelch-like protein 24 [Branchiostoma floridae]
MDNCQSVEDSQTKEDSETVDDSESGINHNEYDESDEYPAWFLQRLHEFRSEGHLVDVTLCAEGKEIPCHRLVLSAFAEYFQSMFSGAHSESKKDKIEIGGVSAEALQLLVDIAYTSKFTVTIDNVQSLYEAANMMQVENVEASCEDFLIGRLRPDTCLATWVLADKVSNTYLSAMARSFALKFFEEVWTADDFLELPVEFLKMYISDDELHVKKEEEVIEAVMLWVRHDCEERQSHLKSLLECVRLSHVDQDYLKNIMDTDKEFAEIPGIKELIKNQSVQARSCQIFRGEILLLGGITDGEDRLRMDRTKPNCDIYRLDADCNCVLDTPLPRSLHDSRGIAACVVNNDVIVTGGNKSLSQAWRYRPSDNSWTKLGSLRKRRHWHGMAVLQEKVYVVGGVKDEIRISDPEMMIRVPHRVFRKETEVYNELTDSWHMVAPLQQAVSSFGITTCSKKIYVFGGHTLLNGTSVVQCYDHTQNVWAFVTPSPYTLQDIKACTVNTKIYLVGGNLDQVLCYDPREDLYEEMAKPIVVWESASATVCGSEIFITGGNDDEYLYQLNHGSCMVQCYNVNNDTMIRVPDLPISLWGHISVTVPKLSW